MGTKVHLTSYLPGFCTMRDLNEDADGCWSQYCEDKMLGQNLYNNYPLRPSNGYPEYDREMLRRTMLEHEAIFRKQVYELHRLYRIQKDMMDDLKRGASQHLHAETSQSNSCSSQIPSEGTIKMLQMSHLPQPTTSNNRAPLTVIDDKKPVINFLNVSNMQSGSVSVGEGIALKDGEMLDSNWKGLSKRTFDLQLPADVYIDCEDERSGKEIVAESSMTTVPPDRIPGSDPGNNVKLNIAVAERPNYIEESWKSDKHARSGSTTLNLGDLNEPPREVCFGKVSDSVSAKFFCPRTSLAENQGLQLPMSSNTSFSGLPSSFLKGKHCNEGTSSNHMHVDDDEVSHGWPFFNNEAGQSTSSMKFFSPGSLKERFSMPSQQIQLNQKCHEILSLHQNKRGSSFKPQHKISRRNPPGGQTALPLANSFSNNFLDYTDAVSTLRSSWTKPANGYSHVPFTVPSLQYFNGITTQNHGNPSDKWHYNGDLRSHFRVGVDSTSYLNGFNHGVRLDYSSASQIHNPPLTCGKPNLSGRSDADLEGCGPQQSQNDVHLNQTLRNGFQNGFAALKINESEVTCEDFSEPLSWLRGKPTSNAASLMELDLSQGYPQLKSIYNVANAGNERRQENGKGSNSFSLQDLSSSSQAREAKPRNVVSDGQSSKKIFGFSIPERTQDSAAFGPHKEQSQTAFTENNVKDKLKLPTLESQISHVDLIGSSSDIISRNHINLNFDLNSTDLSAEGEAINASLPAVVPTVASGIDLEAPIVLEEEKHDEALAKVAAECILLISSEKYSRLDGIPCNAASPVPYNPLHWFAELVSSNSETLKETSHERLDSFELLTLELEETKPEEFWCRSWDGQYQKGDEDRKSSISALLFTKPRRGQARKRRQKRDFQRDILPGIVSLSRHEVTEDIQTIGTLMRASGQSWQAGGTMRRNASRNGTGSRGRAGRRPRSLAVTVEEIEVSPPPRPPPPPPLPQLMVTQPANITEVEVDGRSMIGWGRTTRRCRRQRLPPVANFAAPLT